MFIFSGPSELVQENWKNHDQDLPHWKPVTSGWLKSKDYSKTGIKEEMMLNSKDIKVIQNKKVIKSVLSDREKMNDEFKIIDSDWKEMGYHYFNLVYNKCQKDTKVFMLNTEIMKGIEITYSNEKFVTLMHKFQLTTFTEFVTDKFMHFCQCGPQSKGK